MPVSQTVACAASQISAAISSQDVERAGHRADPDADQHQPVALDAALPGQRVDERCGEQPADQRRDRQADRGEQRRRRSPPPSTITRTAAALAPAVTPRMSGLASGLRAIGLGDRAGQAERGADQHPGQRAGQPQLQDDELAAPRSPAPTSVRQHLGDGQTGSRRGRCSTAATSTTATAPTSVDQDHPRPPDPGERTDAQRRAAGDPGRDCGAGVVRAARLTAAPAGAGGPGR